MAIIAKYKTQREFVSLYLGLFGSSMRLTDNEFKVLVEIIIYYAELKDKVAEPFLSELVLSTTRRKEIQKVADIEESSFNNIISSLKNKGVFGAEKNALLPFLFPVETISFTFVNAEKPVAPQVVEEAVKVKVPDVKPSEEEIDYVDLDSSEYEFTGEEDKEEVIQVKIS